MSRAPAIVDALGNLNPHYQEGMRIPVRDFDVNKVQIDISAKTWTFKTPTLSKVLVTNPDDALGLLLVLSKTEVQSIPASGENFVIIDETAEPDDVRWEGKISPRGWK